MVLSLTRAIEQLTDASRAIQRRGGVTTRERSRIQAASMLLRNGIPSPDTVGARRQTIYLHFLRKVLQLNGQSMVILCAVGLGLSAISITKESIRRDLPYELKNCTSLDNPVLQRLADQFMGKTLSLENSQPPPQVENEAVPEPKQANPQPANANQGKASECYGPFNQLICKIASVAAESSESYIRQFEKILIEDNPFVGDFYEISIEDVKTILELGGVSDTIYLTDTYNLNFDAFVTIPINVLMADRLIVGRHETEQKSV